ncbi:MAG: Hydroxymethylglutaryl-CoA lyase [Aureobasidium pullulans]|nr:MAG: Hydroxymethylglutaryl-CoA lyase [Aureobasidium pullulans]
MLLTLVPDPATEVAEALAGVVSLLSHEVFGTFVQRLVFSAARVEERVTLLMAEIRERGSNRREARECIEGYDGAAVEQLRFLQSGAEGYAAHGGDQGERAQQTVSAPSPASLGARASHHSAYAHLIDLPTDKVGNVAKKGVPFADRATEPPIEKTDHALRAVVLTTADNKATDVGAYEHLVPNVINTLQDKNLERLCVPFAPEVQNNVIAATFTPLRALTSLKQSFFRHEHAFKVTNPGRANLGIMSSVSAFCKEGSPNNTIAVGSDNILSLTLPFGQVHDRCDEDNCGLVFPEQNISLDKLDLEAMTHLESRPPMLRELDLLGTFDLHQSPIATGREVRPNKKAKAAGDNAEEDLIGTFVAWISQRGLVPTGLNAFLSGIVEHYCQRALPSIYQERLHHQDVLLT